MSTPRPTTSASNLHRRASCPGSERLEAGIPEIASEEATEGTMLHAILAGNQPTPQNLKDEQVYCLSFCTTETERLMAQVFGAEAPKIEREVTLELLGTEFGHADVVMLHKGTALVIDFKMGRIEVEAAQNNLQLRAYAAATRETLFVSKVFVAIVQPRLEDRNKRVHLAEYGTEDLSASVVQIRAILEACKAPDAPLHPTPDGCKYCRAVATCPAVERECNELSLVDIGIIQASNAADIWRKARIVESKLKAIKGRCFFVVNNAIAENRPTPGIGLKKGKEVRTVSNAAKAYAALSSKLTADEFASCCKVQIGKLEGAWKKATELKHAEAKSNLAALLDGNMTKKAGKCSLVLDGEIEEPEAEEEA